MLPLVIDKTPDNQDKPETTDSLLETESTQQRSSQVNLLIIC